MKTIQTACIAALLALSFAPDAAEAQDQNLGDVMMSLDGTAEVDIAAATGWHICDIVRTGAGWGKHYVALTCPNGPFTNKWHEMPSGQQDAMLATALAAATSGNKVQVNIFAGSPYNRLNAIYLHK